MLNDDLLVEVSFLGLYSHSTSAIPGKTGQFSVARVSSSAGSSQARTPTHSAPTDQEAFHASSSTPANDSLVPRKEHAVMGSIHCLISVMKLNVSTSLFGD